MKILALDTSTPRASLALLEDREPVVELEVEAGGKYSEQLIPAIASLLTRAEVAPSSVEAYAVGLGPGSFSGLRSGLSVVKGLALANPGPVVGVSSLHALAYNAGSFAGEVVALIDARRNEVFAARFRSDGRGKVTRESDDAALAPERAADLAGAGALFLGPGLLRYRTVILERTSGQAVIAPESEWFPRAAEIGRLGFFRLQAGDSDHLDSLTPIYVRYSRSDLKLDP